MNYTLPRTGQLAAHELYGVYPSGSAYLLDYSAIPAESSRSDSSDRPQVIITLDRDSLKDACMKRLLTPGAFFAVWRELSDTLYSPSPAIEVRLASYLSAPTPRYIPPREKLEEAVSIFTLNVTQTAEVFGVSRTAIYDWREGKAVSQKHQERISQIYEYTLALKEVDSTPIGEALTWQDAESGQSLLSLLTAEPLDDARIRQFIKALPERIQEWWAPANALIAAHNKDGWAPVPDALREERRNRSAGRNVRLGRSNLEIP